MDSTVLTDRLMRPAEVAHVLAVSTKTVLRLVESGRLPGVRVGARIRVARAELERYLEVNRQAHPAP